MFPFLASNNPIHHILDKPISGTEHITLLGKPALTMHMASLIIAATIAFIVLRCAAKRISIGKESEGTDRYLTKGRLSQIIEVITIYMRDKVIQPVLGHDTNKFLPYLLSLFFFILVCNILGMIPFADIQVVAGKITESSEMDWAIFGGTATSNLGVTVGLAIVSFVVIQVHAFKSLGIGGWAHHLTGGAPLYLLPIMFPIEFMGMFIKPAALAIRLFANMVAGHTMLAVLTMFGMMAFSATQNWLLTGSIEAVSVVAAVCISFLELFVAFLQAFIFMFLTAVFIGQMSHHDEHEAHAEATH
ncbi:MAG: F0F1 ATP synthase subunit A [Phycisphaerae bacterium]|jgi:F-type H+-transporting ATPase subunit a|nr:F0F1 ATP synthase subunit A [Phycisphaerae bacterium]MBT6269940.1 F0F1 ATP synthase subunit A [Phycisphaerae bacterium]